jgi:hypothetical protein
MSATTAQKIYPGNREVNWEDLKACGSCPRHNAEGAYEEVDGVMHIHCRGNPAPGLIEVAESQDECSHRHTRNRIDFSRRS